MAGLLPPTDSTLEELLSFLTPAELLRCGAASRLVQNVSSSRLLWFRVYCQLYREKFTPPPSWRELQAGAFTDLNIEHFPWSSLARYRSMPTGLMAQQGLAGGDGLRFEDAENERRGMIDVTHIGESQRIFGSQIQSAVLQQHLKPMPLARPVAYVELWVKGGCSFGLVDDRHYDISSHIGWHRGSLGYHGDEGSLYTSSGYSGKKFGPTFGLDPELVVPNDTSRAPRKADCMGVGIELAAWKEDGGSVPASTDVAFFTKNGKLVDAALLPSSRMRYLAFALHRRGDSVSINTGAYRFHFDVESYSQSEPVNLPARNR